MCIRDSENAGWHFNNLLTPEEISLKLKAFAHTEFSDDKYSSILTIKNKIDQKVDLFDRGHKYQKVDIDGSYPEFILENRNQLIDFILN